MGGSDAVWHRAGVPSNVCCAEEETEPGKFYHPPGAPQHRKAGPAPLTQPPLAGGSDGSCAWEGLNDLHILCFLQNEETGLRKSVQLRSHNSPSEAGREAGPITWHLVARPGDRGWRSPNLVWAPGAQGPRRVRCLPRGRGELPMGFD